MLAAMEGFRACNAALMSFCTDRVSLSVIFTVIVTLAFLISNGVVSAPWRRRKKSNFKFFDLPPELREHVYSYLAEDVVPVYPKDEESISPPKIVAMLSSIISVVSRPINYLTPTFIWRPAAVYWMACFHKLRALWAMLSYDPLSNVPRDFPPAQSAISRILRPKLLPFRWLLSPSRPQHTTIAPLLAGRRLHHELSSYITQHSLHRLSITAGNHSSPSLWTLPSHTLTHLRRVELTISATPAMLPAFDPRVAPLDWDLRDRAFAALLAMPALERLTLRVHARGSQIWNPIWLWHYTSHAFKPLAARTKAMHAITFHLSGWSPGENHLVAVDRGTGRWQWRCRNGHLVRPDCDGTMAIREFCRALYDDCDECPPRD